MSLLHVGYNVHYQFQLYHSDLSGNYSGWKVTCISANNGTIQSLLKQEYKDDISVEGLAMRVMGKMMDSTTLGSEKLEFAVLTLDKMTKQLHAKIYKPTEVDALLVTHGQEEDTEMKMA
ncbi:hypothetical protein K439DRAFT_1613363 [Ramaria rubella]|nr:hypothetical protein K439DRAFT_1613363 [Ramaria rubella]